MKIVQSFLTKNPCWKANVKRADDRYVTFQERGPLGLMLHSVGCAQPDAGAFIRGWNKSTYYNSCVHAIIDANTGDVHQLLHWNYRGWHGGGSCNDTHIGVEMCESKFIKYEKNSAGFEVLDRVKARADAMRAYNSAVELFAYLCDLYHLNPDTAILSHREGGKTGIATGHVDPEHYWAGLGLSYSMNSFRAAVKRKLAAAQNGPVYLIQVGAFRNKTYAEAYLRTVQAAFPGAYMKTKDSA